MSENQRNERPDAAPGSRDEAPRPVQGKEPIDKTGAPGVPTDPAAPSSASNPPEDVRPLDIATDSDWPAASGKRTPQQPPDDGNQLEQTGREAMTEHARAQEEDGGATGK